MEHNEQYWYGFIAGLQWILSNTVIPWDVYFYIRMKQQKTFEEKLKYETAVQNTSCGDGSSVSRENIGGQQ